MTKYMTNKYGYGGSGKSPLINRDIAVASEEQWTKDVDNVEYSCRYCRRTMHKTKIVDSSHQNPNPSISLYCSFCGILSEVEEDTRKKSRVQVHKGKVTEVAVGYAPEPGLKRKQTKPKGTFRKLQERGMKIRNYSERNWRKEKDDGNT